MLFMIIVKASHSSEQGIMPSATLMESMTKYNQELEAAGVRVMAEGLQPSSNGLRISYGSDSSIAKIKEGPFEDPSSLVAGFFLIKVSSKEEALYWAKKVPDPQGLGEGQIELRQLYE